MNFLNQAQSALGGLSGGQQNQQQQQVPADGQQASQGVPSGVAGQSTGQQDALDKGVDTVLNRFGHGQNVATTEKISDGVRSAFKSATGKDIPIADKQ